MIDRYAARRHNLTPVLTGAAIMGAGTLASISVTLLSGTKTGLALALAAVAGPALFYLAVFAPIVFPFGVYVMLVPFDNLLDVSAFGTLTKGLGILSGLAILAFLLRTHRAVRPPKALLFWGLLVLWMAGSAFWALDQRSVFQELPTYLELVLLYAAISIFPSDREMMRWAVIATIIGGMISAAYGAYLFNSGIDLAGRGNRLWILTDTSEIDPNQFAAALLLPIALCSTIALYTRKYMTAIASLAALAVMLVGLVETGSRGAMLGFAAMVVYVFIRTRQRWRLAIAALPIAIVLGVLDVHASMWSRFAQSVSTGGSGRLPIWTVGLAALRSHWLIGAGYNNFGFAYDKVLMAVPQPHFANWHRAPHDLLLETSVELGIVGLALLLAGWVSQFQMMRGVATNDPDYRFRLALEAALIATFVAALFLDVMITKYVWLMFMLIALLRNAHAGARRTWGASSVLAAAPAIRGSTPGLGKTGRDLVV